MTLVSFAHSIHFDEQTGNRTSYPGAESDAEDQPGTLGGTGGEGRAYDFELGDGEGERTEETLLKVAQVLGYALENRAMKGEGKG